MPYTPRTIWADLNSAEVFFRHVRRSGRSYRELADDVERELKKIAREERRRKRDDSTVPQTCSHALIGQLITGKATTVHELRAIAIERALGVPEGDLFTIKMMRDARNGVPA
jgi:hypothetical protein